MSSSGVPFTRSKKTKPSPPPQPFEKECTDSSSEEEEIPPPPPPKLEQQYEDSSSSSEEEDIPPPAPPQSEQHYEDAKESSDDENTEEDQDARPVTKPKQNPQNPAALAVVSPQLHRERQLALDTSSGVSPLTLPSKRIWQDSMQILLLKQMVDYSEINGKCKVSLSYIYKFHSSLRGSPLSKFSVNQILEKMKRFKKKYDSLYGKGKGKRKGMPLNPDLLELLKKLWGETEKDKGKKRKRVKVEEVENGGHDDIDDDDDEGDNSIKETTVWENAMVRLMEEVFHYKDNYTRQKIASLDNFTRNLLEKMWLNRKGKLNAAIVNLSRAENDCLKVLLSP